MYCISLYLLLGLNVMWWLYWSAVTYGCILCLPYFPQVLSRSSLLVTERKRAEFTNKDAGQDLSRLVRAKDGAGKNVAARPEMDHTSAIAALAAAIKYLEVNIYNSDYQM